MTRKAIYFTLEKKLTLSFSLLFVTFLTIFLLIFLILVKQNSDALIINLLGKQSLLFQKITTLMLSIRYTNTDQQELKTTIKEIDSHLKSLRDGGIISDSIKIKGVTDKSVFTQLTILIRLWDEYKNILEYYLQTKDEGLFQAALSKNKRLIDESTKATNLMQDASLLRVALIRYTLISGLIVFLIVYLVSRKIIHNFINNLNIFINYFELGSQGDFSNYLQLKSKDETQKLAIFFNNFISKLVSILDQIKTTVKNNRNSFEILNQKTENTSIAINNIFISSKTTLDN